MIEQTRFLSTVFLRSEFKSENIYSGLNFCGKHVCGNFYLRELILQIAGKIANIRTRKNVLSHGMIFYLSKRERANSFSLGLSHSVKN